MCVLHNDLKVWITRPDTDGVYFGKCWDEFHYERYEACIVTILFHEREVTQWYCPD